MHGTKMATQIYEPAPFPWQKQLDRFAHMTGEQRVRLAFSMSSMEMLISKNVIKRENPAATQEELDIIFVRTCYGDELADRVAAYLAKRRETR